MVSALLLAIEALEMNGEHNQEAKDKTHHDGIANVGRLVVGCVLGEIGPARGDAAKIG